MFFTCVVLTPYPHSEKENNNVKHNTDASKSMYDANSQCQTKFYNQYFNKKIFQFNTLMSLIQYEYIFTYKVGI